MPNLEFKSSFGVWEKSNVEKWRRCEEAHLVTAKVALSYFENVEIKSVGSIDEVQCPGRHRDGELVVQDLAVQLPLEQLWLPGLRQTVGHLQNQVSQRIIIR